MYQLVNCKTNDQGQRECVSWEQKSTEQEQSPDKSDSTARRRTELSLALKITMVSSLLSIASAVSFITWLWWASRDSRLWRSWVLIENRTQLSITITTLVIRAAIGLLASIATSMIASVAIERHGVSVQSVAQLSITRYASSGPLSLGPLVLKDPILNIRARSIIFLLIFTTIPAQFASSFLMLDLEGRNVVSLPRVVPTSGASALRIDPQAWRRSPILAHTFAEHSETGTYADGVDDTGISIRALLPIAAQKTREKLRDFQGIARVIDSRVVCLRPEILDLAICTDHWTNVTSICGKARLSESLLKSVGLQFHKYEDDENTFDIHCPFERGFPRWHGDFPTPSKLSPWALCWPKQANNHYPTYRHPSSLSLYNETTSYDWMILWSPSPNLWKNDLNWQNISSYATHPGPWARPLGGPKRSGLDSTKSTLETELFNMTACFTFQRYEKDWSFNGFLLSLHLLIGPFEVVGNTNTSTYPRQAQIPVLNNFMTGKTAITLLTQSGFWIK